MSGARGLARLEVVLGICWTGLSYLVAIAMIATMLASTCATDPAIAPKSRLSSGSRSGTNTTAPARGSGTPSGSITRRFTASTFPFGAELHHADARTGLAPAAVADELRAELRARGHADVHVEPIAPGIEDAFMALMGAPPEAAA